MRKILLLFMLLLSLVNANAQKTKISEMPTASGDGSGAFLPIVQGGVNKKILIDSIIKDLLVGKYLYLDTVNGKQRLNVDSTKLAADFGGGGGGSQNLQQTTLFGNTTTRTIQARRLQIDGSLVNMNVDFNRDSSGNALQTGFVGAIGFNKSTGQMYLQSSVASVASGSAPSFGTVPFVINADHSITFPGQGGGFFTGTVAKILGVTNTGKLIDIDPASLGGGSAQSEAKERFTSSTTAAKTIAHTPLFPTAVEVFLNGVLQDTGQYSISGTTVTLGFSPILSDVVTIKYSY